MCPLRINGTPDECVKMVKALLPFIGNISGFSVYENEEDVPKKYLKVPDVYLWEEEREDQNFDYHLILNSANWEQEVWVQGGNCGYGGSGPGATEEILQLLGIKMDYSRISREKIIVMKDIKPFHDLNFLLHEAEDPLNMERIKRMKVTMSFKKPHEKWAAKEVLQTFGYMQPLCLVERDYPESYFFRLPYPTKGEWADYKTNYSLTLHSHLNPLDNGILCEMIQQIGYDYHSEFKVKEYERA